jgi:hypothetical protein
MVAGDLFGVMGKILKHMYIPTEIKKELVRWCELLLQEVSFQDCSWRIIDYSFQQANYTHERHHTGYRLSPCIFKCAYNLSGDFFTVHLSFVFLFL